MREPSEPQLVQRHPAVMQDNATDLQTTYLRIPQVSNRAAVVLSRSCWMWGAQMGCNEHGVVIGMVDTFTKTRSLKKGLLGEDLVRLSLERAASADEALHVLTALLEQHGQGGPSGYRNAQFHADSSFIIADAQYVWIVETAAQHWVAKRLASAMSSWSLSNFLTITTDFDQHSSGLYDFAQDSGYWDGNGQFNFAQTFDTRWQPRWLQARSRADESGTTHSGLILHGMMQALRCPSNGMHTPRRGGNGDVCLHAGGVVRQFQTVSSMVSQLSQNGNTHCFTGSSSPCMSMFKPVSFSRDLIGMHGANEVTKQAFWVKYENVHRRMLFSQDQLNSFRTRLVEAEAELLALITPSNATFQASSHEGSEEAAQLLIEQHLEATFAWADALDIWHGLGPYGLYWYRLNLQDGVKLKYLPLVGQ